MITMSKAALLKQFVPPLFGSLESPMIININCHPLTTNPLLRLLIWGNEKHKGGRRPKKVPSDQRFLLCAAYVRTVSDPSESQHLRSKQNG